jgi:hypothetical protein
MALQVLSTRHGFTLLGNSHSLSLLASGGGGGGFSTVTWAEFEAVRPRESVQVALAVIVPEGAPVVLRVAVPPSPEMVPPLAVQPLTVTGTLSGLVQVQVSVEGVPAWTDVGFAEQDMVGGFFGGSFTVKVALQLASPPFFTFGSVIREVTV